MGEQDGFNVGRIDAGRLEIGHEFAGRGGQVIARPGFNERQATGGVDEEGIDGCAARRPETLRQDLARLCLGDLAQHVEPAIEMAIAQRRDEDVADTAVVDAWYLLLRDPAHALLLLNKDCGKGCGMRRPVKSRADALAVAIVAIVPWQTNRR